MVHFWSRWRRSWEGFIWKKRTFQEDKFFDLSSQGHDVVMGHSAWQLCTIDLWFAMSRKRKYTRRGSPDYNAGGDIEEQSSHSSNSVPLFVQGHEATITRDRPDLVQALTAHDLGDGKGKGGLIQWNGEGLTQERDVWVDRYAFALKNNSKFVL